MNFSPRTHISPSRTVAVNSLALEKRLAGERVYNLSAGEPMIGTPAVISRAAMDAIDAGKTHYESVSGIPALRDAVSTWMNTTYGSHFSRTQTLVTAGGKHGVSLLVDAMLIPGDEALIVAPYWVSYVSQVEMAGATPVVIPTAEKDGWKVTPADIDAHCTAQTKLLILNNGSNPAGVLYTTQELQAILDMAAQHDIVVISDEVYSGLVYDGVDYISCASFADHVSRVIVVQSMSKHFAMTGWRVGFVFADEQIIRVLCTLQGQTTSGASTISQWAALAGLQHADDIVPVHRAQMQARRDVFCQRFGEAFGHALPPAGSGLYQFIPLTAFGIVETDADAFCTRVLAEANVAMVPGEAFGVGGYVRCSFGETEEELKDAIEALHAYLVK
ncbi:MAG: aspartate aminotransferase [Candidatus Magasanikbacteria bacterium CG10_big_fil_rev_8_21_14_0_10_42_10]|uniref:Aminotransferase n=2 Tax=Candidatus Magasanikiibacteriota TaxID=1752731 RepID=A0A2H0TVY2_9BACT|nr:MAG: aspartate aminotransferase [Candidatus Magasanikbacteria bacterium CG10_big_fil_rev_8_21_14_0_10_42_10]PIZ94206.1 MAG: aspartate aminotransferase [Candidatus Magasanikbacteria bacterium CG_4_10_14_0_2_um_filter_41_10]